MGHEIAIQEPVVVELASYHEYFKYEVGLANDYKTSLKAELDNAILRASSIEAEIESAERGIAHIQARESENIFRFDRKSKNSEIRGLEHERLTALRSRKAAYANIVSLKIEFERLSTEDLAEVRRKLKHSSKVVEFARMHQEKLRLEKLARELAARPSKK